MINVLSVLLRKMGVLFEYQIQKEGFYPKGGGLVKLQVQPVYFKILLMKFPFI